MAEENTAAAMEDWAAPAEEERTFLSGLQQRKALADSYCTGCEYCMPCPSGVNIPACFSVMNLLRVWEQPQQAALRWRMLKQQKGDPSPCTQCGACEEKCPQKIAIREQLKEVASEMAGQKS
jgi:uncharacterized protein